MTTKQGSLLDQDLNGLVGQDHIKTESVGKSESIQFSVDGTVGSEADLGSNMILDQEPEIKEESSLTKKQKMKIQADRKARYEKAAKLLDQSRASDRKKRYEHLLGKTQLFSHFINLAKMKSDDAEAYKVASDAKPGETVTVDHRHRKTEKEEDAELLADEENEEDAIFQFEESPFYVKFAKMREYQIQGLNWLITLFQNGINGILADEMGLGKTLQTISFLGYLKHYQNIEGPHLVIVPKSTLHNWVSEFKRWVPSLDVFMYHGSKDGRQLLNEEKLLPMDFEVCVTSYEMCLLEKNQFKKIPWQYIAIDEAHRIKNENSALSQIVREFNCRNRLLITGTPLQNNIHELWALLNFLLPDIFSSSEDFDNWFGTQGGSDNEDNVVKQLHKVLSPFLLRRIKADVEHSLLPKIRKDVYIGMTNMQRKWYKNLLEKDIDAVNDINSGSGKTKTTRLQNIVMQLRKCCNHPYLFDGAEPGPPFTTDEHLVNNAGKMIILDKLLKFLKERGSRVLLFSQMSRMLDIFEDYCVFRGFEYCRIDGNTPHDIRVQHIDEYNKPDSEKYIFLLTTRAGGLGINLATADVVIMYDSDWNPQVDLQAEDRAHRIGQKKQVYVYRFITENAVEEKVIDRASQKLRLDQLVIQQGRQAQQSKSANKEDLVSMIQHGAKDIFESLDSTVSADEDILAILDRSEEKQSEQNKRYANMGLDELQNFTTGGQSVYEWEGSDFRKNNQQSNFLGWIGPSKRERKTTSYNETEYYARALNTGIRTRPTGPRAPKQVTVQDHQFYPPALKPLLDREMAVYRKQIKYKVTPEVDGPELTEEQIKVLQDEIENAVPLTEEEQEQKELLIAQGFPDWNKKDLQAFFRAQDKYGRDDIENIVLYMDGIKEADDVRRYHKVFWQRYKELDSYERMLANLERGEARLKRIRDVQGYLQEKIKQVKVPLQQLKFNYGQSKGKLFSEDEDRFLVVTMERLGYGTDNLYERIQEEIRKSPLFRFDWFLKSRTALEIQRRCSTLVIIIGKEFGSKNENDDEDDDVASHTGSVSSKRKLLASHGENKRSKA